jgi:hypothetical protein
MDNEFPSNSKTPGAVHPTQRKTEAEGEKSEEKKVKQVTTGTVVTRKKPLGRRFKETFISGADSKSVFEYVTFEILIPAGKDLFLDAMNAGIERKFYGEVRSNRRRSTGGFGGGSNVSYNAMSKHTHPLNREEPRGSLGRRRTSHDIGEIVVETRAEALEVIDMLYELLSRYDVATVADLYDMVGERGSHTDNRWGWTNLTGADVHRERGGGYVLILPRPEPID